jgi:hypothetical protein
VISSLYKLQLLFKQKTSSLSVILPFFCTDIRECTHETKSQIKVLWVVTQYIVLWLDTNISELYAASIFRVKWLGWEKNGTDIGLDWIGVAIFSHPSHFTLKMEAALTSEMLVSYHSTALCHLKQCHHETLKTHMKQNVISPLC